MIDGIDTQWTNSYENTTSSYVTETGVQVPTSSNYLHNDILTSMNDTTSNHVTVCNINDSERNSNTLNANNVIQNHKSHLYLNWKNQ